VPTPDHVLPGLCRLRAGLPVARAPWRP
jgi:hypothetical protein